MKAYTEEQIKQALAVNDVDIYLKEGDKGVAPPSSNTIKQINHMITHEEYQKAKQIIMLYEEQINYENKQIFDEMQEEEDPDEPCDICGFKGGQHDYNCPEDDSSFGQLLRLGYD